MPFLRALAVAMLSVLLLPSFAAAHSLNQSYVYFQVSNDGVTGRMEVTFEDIDRTFPLDADGDGEITVTEFEARAEGAFAAVTKGLKLWQDGRELQLRSSGFDTLDSGEKLDHTIFALFPFEIIDLDGVPDALEVTFEYLYNDIDPTHTGFALIEENIRTGISDNEAFASLIFRQGSETQVLSLGGQSWIRVFTVSIWDGILQIWALKDHLLLVVAFLIPAVMTRTAGRWEPRATVANAMWQGAKITALFAIGLSITFFLATQSIVRMSPDLIVFVMALSVVVLAINNVFPFPHRLTWLMVLGSGLIHGFGLTYALWRIGIDPQHEGVTFAGFNFGIVLGLAVLVLLLVPAFFGLRKSAIYKPGIMIGLSCLLMAIAMFWTIERSPELVEGFGRVLERGTLTPDRSS